tara:strand:- start:1871 stop:3391 length:1521 start_codon:yes stop_codon:yes gene_type:complete
MTWWNSSRLHPKTQSKFVVVFGSDFYIPSVKSVGKPKVDFDTKEYRLINHKFNYPGNATWQPIELKFVDMNGLALSNESTFDTSAFLWQILNNSGYAYPYLDGSSTISKNPYYNNVEDEKKTNSGGHHIATRLTFRDDLATDTEEGTSYRTITTPEKASTIANSFGGGLSGRIDQTSANTVGQKISIYQLSPEGPETNDLIGGTVTEAWHLVNPIVKSIGWGDLAYDSDNLIEYSLNIVYDWAIYDRDAIGKQIQQFNYQTFKSWMKNYAQAQASIDAEVDIQENLADLEAAFADQQQTIMDLEDYDPNFDVRGVVEENQEMFKDGFFDADGDGVMSPAEREFSLQNKEEIEQQLAAASTLEQEILAEELQAQAAERSIAAVVRAGEDAVFNQGIQDAEDSFTQDFAEDLEIAVLEQNQERLDALAEEEVEIQKAQEILDAYRAEQEQLEKMNRQTQDEIARLDEILEYDQANREDEARLDRETIQTQAEKEAKRFFEENRPNDID